MVEDEIQAKAQQTQQKLDEAKKQATRRTRLAQDGPAQGEQLQAQNADELQDETDELI